MNNTSREYAFGRAFNISLSENHTRYLAQLVNGDSIALLGLDASCRGLIRRGLIELHWEKEKGERVRITKAGILVYQLLVEAGEYKALEDAKLELFRLEHERDQREWEDRFGSFDIKLKDRFLRT